MLKVEAFRAQKFLKRFFKLQQEVHLQLPGGHGPGQRPHRP